MNPSMSIVLADEHLAKAGHEISRALDGLAVLASTHPIVAATVAPITDGMRAALAAIVVARRAITANPGGGDGRSRGAGMGGTAR